MPMEPAFVTLFFAALPQAPTALDGPSSPKAELDRIEKEVWEHRLEEDVFLRGQRHMASTPVLDCGELPLSVLSDRGDRFLEGKARER